MSGTGHPHRRADDVRTTVEADALEKWWAQWRDMPDIIHDLQDGRTLNRRLIIFIIAMFLLGGYVVDRWDEQRQDDIDLVRARFYQQCLDINANAKTINEFLNQQINNTMDSPVLDPAEKSDRILGYNKLRQAEPVCFPPDKE